MVTIKISQISKQPQSKPQKKTNCRGNIFNIDKKELQQKIGLEDRYFWLFENILLEAFNVGYEKGLRENPFLGRMENDNISRTDQAN